MQMKVRIASKQIEKKLVETAKKFRENPLLALPECIGDCKKCYFEKLKKDVEKLREQKYIEKFAGKRGFIGALASVILLSEQKIPYVAHMKIGSENIYYAKRGKAKDEILAGLQNWDKPHIRLLAYLEMARKKKINLFSMPDKLICSKEPPQQFIEYMKSLFSCGSDEYIEIIWRGVKIKACGNRNTLLEMKKYFYYPDFEKEIELDIKIDVIKCKMKCKECLIKDALQQKLDFSHYINGEMGDRSFMENYRKKIMWNIEGIRVFMIGNECYGNDIEAFMEKLSPKEWEEEAVREILRYERKAIILEQPSAAKLLEKYGVNHEKLRKEYYEKRKEKILKNLPKIGGGEIAEFVDSLARAYRVEGKEGVMKLLKEKKMDVKEKAISYAFLYAMGIKGEEWKYTKMEIEFGKHLARHVKKLLTEEGENYENAFRQLLKEVG